MSGKNLAVFKMAALLISINVILLSNRKIPSHERARVKISYSAKIQNPKRETNVWLHSKAWVDWLLYSSGCLFIYLFVCLFICFASPTDEDLRSVAVIVTRTHIALAEENPQWPIPRYMDPPSPLKGPEFVCVAKHKITDVTSLVSNTRNRS